MVVSVINDIAEGIEAVEVDLDQNAKAEQQRIRDEDVEVDNEVIYEEVANQDLSEDQDPHQNKVEVGIYTIEKEKAIADPDDYQPANEVPVQEDVEKAYHIPFDRTNEVASSKDQACKRVHEKIFALDQISVDGI